MSAPKAVVFDIGNVLLNFDYGVAIGKLAAHSSMSEPDLHRLINQSPLLYRYETGLISTDEFFSEIRAASGYRGDAAQFRPHFCDIFTPIPEMIGLNDELRALGLPTYIFSNTNELAVAHMRETYPFFRNFDAYFFSYESRAMKPHPDIYADVEKGTGRSGQELLYMDDRLENVETALARGWRAIHHQTPAKTVAEVRGLGLGIR